MDEPGTRCAYTSTGKCRCAEMPARCTVHVFALLGCIRHRGRNANGDCARASYCHVGHCAPPPIRTISLSCHRAQLRQHLARRVCLHDDRPVHLARYSCTLPYQCVVRSVAGPHFPLRLLFRGQYSELWTAARPFWKRFLAQTDICRLSTSWTAVRTRRAVCVTHAWHVCFPARIYAGGREAGRSKREPFTIFVPNSDHLCRFPMLACLRHLRAANIICLITALATWVGGWGCIRRSSRCAGPLRFKHFVQSITVAVFTPGQQDPSIGTGTGNVINKGLTSDFVGGVRKNAKVSHAVAAATRTVLLQLFLS